MNPRYEWLHRNLKERLGELADSIIDDLDHIERLDRELGRRRAQLEEDQAEHDLLLKLSRQANLTLEPEEDE